MRFRNLRIAWSVAWGLVAVLLCVLWARSYWQWDSVKVRTSFRNQMNVWSKMGFIHSYTGFRGGITPSVEVLSFPVSSFPHVEQWGWKWEDGSHWEAKWPHWFAAAIVAALAYVPWLSSRFSLRTLLIAMTLIALVLGAIVYAVR
jgi:hypothetical protein